MTIDASEYCQNCGSAGCLPADKFCRRCGATWRQLAVPSLEQFDSLGPGASVRSPEDSPLALRKRLQPVPGLIRGQGAVLTLLVILMGLLMVDRLWLHVYSPDVGSLNTKINDQATALQSAQATESRDYLDVQGRIKDVDKNVQNALNTQPSVSPDDYLRDLRMASSLSVLSLLTAYGGSQSAGSAAGKACTDYFLMGTGSFTDCGFTRQP